MKIPSVNQDGFVPTAKPKAPATKATPSRSAEDVFKPEQNQKLMNQILSEPDTRPEMVERARALVADANYPSSAVLGKVAENFLSEFGASK